MRYAAIILFLAAASLWAQGSDAELRKKIVEYAQTLKGIPYVYGADAPPAFDCSGFVQYVYRKAVNISLPRNSKSQAQAGTPIKRDGALPGDVIVFDTVGGGSVSHIAIYLGDGQMIHAASAGKRTGIIVGKLDDAYFGPRYLGARTFLSVPSATASASPAPSQPAAPPARPPAAVSASPSAAAAPSKPAASAQPPVQPPAPSTAQSVKPPTVQPTAPAAQPARPTQPAAAPAAASTVPSIAPPTVEPPATARPSAISPPTTEAARVFGNPDEPAIAQIGFVIPPKTGNFPVYEDPIPTAIGTHVAFTVTNGTGAEDNFTVLFYKSNIDFKKIEVIHQERVRLPKGGVKELAPYLFTEPGTYKLIVKSSWNDQLLERRFKVIPTPRN